MNLKIATLHLSKLYPEKTCNINRWCINLKQATKRSLKCTKPQSMKSQSWRWICKYQIARFKRHSSVRRYLKRSTRRVRPRIWNCHRLWRHWRANSSRCRKISRLISKLVSWEILSLALESQSRVVEENELRHREYSRVWKLLRVKTLSKWIRSREAELVEIENDFFDYM